MKEKLGLVLVATNKYVPLGLRMVNRLNHFCNNKDDMRIYLYTDVDVTEFVSKHSNVTVVNINKKHSWGAALFLRMKALKEVASSNDHEFVAGLDADSNIYRSFDVDELVAENFVFEHSYITNGRQLGEWWPFETNPNSIAYVDPASNPKSYYQICYFGGTPKNVIKMTDVVFEQLDIDLKNNAVPTHWPDERYMQKYFVEFPPTRLFNMNTFPIIIDDKGMDNFVSGVDELPFFGLTQEEYDDLVHKTIMYDGLWNIKNNKFIAE
jgi:hypothetical protein